MEARSATTYARPLGMTRTHVFRDTMPLLAVVPLVVLAMLMWITTRTVQQRGLPRAADTPSLTSPAHGGEA
jgi:hypothetical protein